MRVRTVRDIPTTERSSMPRAWEVPSSGATASHRDSAHGGEGHSAGTGEPAGMMPRDPFAPRPRPRPTTTPPQRQRPASSTGAEQQRLGPHTPLAVVAAGLVALALVVTGVAATVPNGPAPGWLEAWLRPDEPPPVPAGSPQPSPGDGSKLVAGKVDLAMPSQPPAAAAVANKATRQCPAPLSVVADPDIAELIAQLAGQADRDACPRLAITARESTDVLAELTDDGAREAGPDVWIPASSLWLRLADSRGTEPSFGPEGTSIARSPVVMAVPTPLYENNIKGPNVWPVWIVVYDYVTGGRIPTMHMPDPGTTDEGALTLVALWEAMLFHSERNSDGAAMRTINLRNHLATTDADTDALLDELAGMTDGADSGTQVGMFPATEQKLLAYNDRDPAVPITLMGLYDAITEADYPMAVSTAVDDQQAEAVEELRARLRSSEALQRLVDAGFRPPRDARNQPAELRDTQRWPDYPEPVSLPDASGWNTLMHLWSLD